MSEGPIIGLDIGNEVIKVQVLNGNSSDKVLEEQNQICFSKRIETGDGCKVTVCIMIFSVKTNFLHSWRENQKK